MNKLLISLLAMSLTCISVSSFAADGKEKRFNKMDTNKDGMISQDEYMKNQESLWSKFKKNSKGMVDASTMEDGSALSMEGDVHKPDGVAN